MAAVADSTRRGILVRLGRGDRLIGELAANFDITRIAITRHVRPLKAAQLVTTDKIGRVRTVKLRPHRLEREPAWIAKNREMLDARLHCLGEFPERQKGTS